MNEDVNIDMFWYQFILKYKNNSKLSSVFSGVVSIP